MKHLGIKKRILLVTFSVVFLSVITVIISDKLTYVHDFESKGNKVEEVELDKKTGKTKKITEMEIGENVHDLESDSNKVEMDEKTDLDKDGKKGEEVDKESF